MQNGDRRRANDALSIYRDGERDSAMDYEVWRDVYLRLEPDIIRLGELSNNAAAAQGVASGNLLAFCGPMPSPTSCMRGSPTRGASVRTGERRKQRRRQRSGRVLAVKA